MTYRNVPYTKLYHFFVENKTAIKINNLLVAHWLHIFCKRCGVKQHNCSVAASVPVTSLSCLPLHTPELIYPEDLAANSQYAYLNSVDFSVWGALQQKLYR